MLLCTLYCIPSFKKSRGKRRDIFSVRDGLIRRMTLGKKERMNKLVRRHRFMTRLVKWAATCVPRPFQSVRKFFTAAESNRPPAEDHCRAAASSSSRRTLQPIWRARYILRGKIFGSLFSELRYCNRRDCSVALAERKRQMIQKWRQRERELPETMCNCLPWDQKQAHNTFIHSPWRGGLVCPPVS